MRRIHSKWKAAGVAAAISLIGTLTACGGGEGSTADAPAAGAPSEAAAAFAPSSDTTLPLQAERYVLANAGSNQCLEAAPDNVDGARFRFADCNSGATQSFNVSLDASGRYKLLASSGRAMDVAGASGADGATVQQWTDNGTNAQRFAFKRLGGNRFALVNSGSGKCVAPSSSSGLQQLACKDEPAQSFTVHPVASGGKAGPAVGRYSVRSVHSQLCIGIEGASTADGARPLQAACAGDDAQRFDLASAGAGAWRLTNVRSGKSISVAASSTANGAAVQQLADTAGANQRYTATAVGDAFELKARHSGKCLDVRDFSTAVGGVVHQWDCTRSGNQQWRLVADGGTTPSNPVGKSAKRGIAYDVATTGDLNALSPGVSWWYNWSPRPKLAPPAGTDFVPMLWNFSFNDAEIEALLKANPQYKYLLVLNEPNLWGQATMSPADTAAAWPRVEALAAKTGVKIVGPQITWGNLAGFEDPVVWMDAFQAAYRNANGQRAPRIDMLAFHWYDYGLAAQLDRLTKYGKPFWVTEFANWHNGDGSAQIDSVAKQKAQMTEMVGVLENRADVVRYAWFTGRWSNDTHFSSLLGADGQLTELGRHYLSLPYKP
jgi:hypothetical protein